MGWLIDGDNLLGTWPGRRRSDPERRELALELQRIAAARGRTVVVVFDGNAPPGARFGSGVRFAGAGRTADDVIVAFLREQEDPGSWVVVTSDRPLGDHCRHVGARIERCDRFRARLQAPRAEEKPEREGEVERWLGIFEDPP
jgi:predicted RNA-binding protein with PIN domain